MNSSRFQISFLRSGPGWQWDEPWEPMDPWEIDVVSTTERSQHKSMFVLGMNQCLHYLLFFLPDSLETNTSPSICLVTLFLLVGAFGACNHVVELC